MSKLKSIFSFILFFVCSATVVAQTGNIKGRVSTSDGKSAEYINVSVRGTTKGAVTNNRGEFEIRKIDAGQQTLVISYVGLESRLVEVDVKENETIVVPQIVLAESSEQLDEVVVVGERANKFSVKQSDYVAKLPLKSLENPQVYTTISKVLLQEQLVFSVDDAVKNAPGLQRMWDATGRSGDGGSFYNARGFIVQSQLRNGVAGNVTSRIDAANLESIEVIKGPSATLFGSTLTSYGGLINRVTKKPYETFGGEVAFSTGSFGFNRVSADVNTPLNEDKSALFRLNTAYQYDGSFQDNGFERGYVIAPSLSYKLNDRLTLAVDAEFYRIENTAKPFIFFYFPTAQLNATNPEELGLDPNLAYASNDLYQMSKSSNFFVQANYKISEQWTSQTNFTSTHSFSDGPNPYYYVVPNSVVTGDENAVGADYLARAVQSTEGSELAVKEFQQNFIGDFKIGEMRNRFVFGFDIFSQNSNQMFYGADFDIIHKNGSFTADGTIENYSTFTRTNYNKVLQNGYWTWPYEYKTNTYSAYVMDVINLRDNLIAMASLRFDRFDNKGSRNDGSGSFSNPYTQNEFSPKFGLVYQPLKDQVAIFANYQNGFKNQNGIDAKTMKTFTPEHAIQAEGGVKVELLNGKISSTISYYDIQVRDLVRSYTPTEEDLQNPNFPINPQVQDGTQVSRGVEVEVIANPFKGLNVVAGFAYNDSKLERAEDDVMGRRPTTAMSPYAANLWISYHLLDGPLNGLGFGFGGNYASDNKIVNSTSMGVFTLPSYTVLNVSAFYDQPKFRIGLKVDNLTDELYYIGYTTMNVQRPRSVTGSIALKF